ncbi:RNA chaperone Hfq [Bacillus cereus]|uniref:RNA-binding protein Hfq n=2 Tax=Bacillus cereus TaxID=1396 RepID=A0A9X6ZYZ9_BACCE|nr:RNA chaperone Hfq [Bacillus cereus]OUB23773.1 RNA chaperone Hfq [Bacillus thuringiensis serovar yunnanensis]PFK16827.1 RNA chaperone Hfq [Bacillus cereus]
METKLKVLQKERNRNTVSLQEQLLQEALQKKTVITLILLNGFHIKGMIKGYDLYSVLVEAEGKQQFVYKHAISTIRL